MTIDVWDAPKDKATADDQLAAMALFGDSPGVWTAPPTSWARAGTSCT